VLAGTNLAYLISLSVGYFPGHTFGFAVLKQKTLSGIGHAKDEPGYMKLQTAHSIMKSFWLS
jgi:hypothetical protein